MVPSAENVNVIICLLHNNRKFKIPLIYSIIVNKNLNSEEGKAEKRCGEKKVFKTKFLFSNRGGKKKGALNQTISRWKQEEEEENHGKQ